MIAPIVHYNGTSQAELLRQLETAWSAVDAAIEALCQAAPNARDYYVQSSSEAFDQALTEHRGRLARLQAVADELGTLQIAVADQNGGRP